MALDAFREWRMIPAPRCGEIVREVAVELRARKARGALVSSKWGRSAPEGEAKCRR